MLRPWSYLIGLGGYTELPYPEVHPPFLGLQVPPPPAGFQSWDDLSAEREALEAVIASVPSSGKNVSCFAPLTDRMPIDHEQPCSAAWGTMRAGSPSARQTS